MTEEYTQDTQNSPRAFPGRSELFLEIAEKSVNYVKKHQGKYNSFQKV